MTPYRNIVLVHYIIKKKHAELFTKVLKNSALWSTFVNKMTFVL